MKVIVLGCGNIGSVIARDLAENLEGADVVVADRDRTRARETASRITGARWAAVDGADLSKLVDAINKFDLVVGALPGDYGYQSIRASIMAGVDMVDISFTPENPLELDSAAKEAGVTVVPDCGVAPGLSNMLVGYSAARLDKVRGAHIMVGGIPEYPVPPLGYTVTWSAEGLIDEYVRDVSIVEGGRIVRVPALSGLEEIEFPGVGRLEAFYTDGLRMLIDTFQGVESMWEKTLRYPGHVEKIKLLKALGFLDEEDVKVGDNLISPRVSTARILERSLKKPEVGDLLAMKVEVEGESRGETKKFSCSLLDRFDGARGVTAMARTTGYTAAGIARMLARGMIKTKGVIPPEKVGMDASIFGGLISDLRERGIRVEGV